MRVIDHFSFIHILTQTLRPEENTDSFAYTNAILDSLAQIKQPVLHFWTLTDSLILGLSDQRLPHLNQALNLLKVRNYHYFVRNSGGLAVISDAGILNVSLFIPDEDRNYSVNAAYEEMANVIKSALPELTIDTGEIIHSYCPGTFDLSVNGQKIGGMSQRRNVHGVVIMVYLSVNGDQPARGQLVADFYRAGLQTAKNQWDFPDVHPDSMVNLSTVMNQPLSIIELEQRLSTFFTSQMAGTSLTQVLGTPEFHSQLAAERSNMQARQQKLESRRQLEL